MAVIVPTGTDAPIYHYPISTVALICTNIGIFICGCLGYFDPEPHILAFGSGFHPSQWVTSVFLHVGPIHLLGNMIFLFVFGLVVEGKIGWWKFLGVYLLLGICESFASQTVMLFFEGKGGALGASGAIMGIMAMAVVWAPASNVSFTWVLYYRTFDFECNMLAVGFFYFGLELILLAFIGFKMSSQLLHLLGVVPGLALGFVFVTRKWVDCEGHDLLNSNIGEDWWAVLYDRHWWPEQKEPAIHKAARLKGERQGIKDSLAASETDRAIRQFHKLRVEDSALQWTELELLTIVKQYRLQGRIDDCIPYLREYLKRFQRRALEVRMMLAEYSLYMEQPREALQLLEPIFNSPLSPKLHHRREAIIRRARQIDSETLQFKKESA